jgi:hypothetical protein
MKSDELLDSAAELIYDKLDTVGGDPLQLPAVLQPIAILYTIQAMRMIVARIRIRSGCRLIGRSGQYMPPIALSEL